MLKIFVTNTILD